MKIDELKWLLKDKRVLDEIQKHKWIESQKSGFDIGIARATDEWLKLYSEGWIKFHMSDKPKKNNDIQKPKK